MEKSTAQSERAKNNNNSNGNKEKENHIKHKCLEYIWYITTNRNHTDTVLNVHGTGARVRARAIYMSIHHINIADCRSFGFYAEKFQHYLLDAKRSNHFKTTRLLRARNITNKNFAHVLHSLTRPNVRSIARPSAHTFRSHTHTHT